MQISTNKPITNNYKYFVNKLKYQTIIKSKPRDNSYNTYLYASVTNQQTYNMRDNQIGFKY